MIQITRASEITQIDLLVLHELLNHPDQSWRTIAHSSNLSQNDIRKSYYKMKQYNLLKGDSNIQDPNFGFREITEVEADYIPNKLGLQRSFIIIKNLQPKDIPVARRILESHPYIHLLTQTIFDGMEIFAIIDHPIGSETLIRDFSQQIAEICSGSLDMLTNITFEDKSYFNYEYLSQEKKNAAKISKLYSLSSVFPNKGITQALWEDFLFSLDHFTPQSPEEQVVDIDTFDHLDLLLIRELTINAKISNKTLAGLYDLNPSTISKRIKKIKEEFIKGYNLHFNRDFFNLNSYMILGNYQSAEITTQELHSFVKSAIPFGSQLISTDDHFLWNFTVSHELALDSFDFISQVAPSSEFHLIIPRTLFRFYLNTQNYDINSGWKTSEDYLVEIPISKGINQFGKLQSQN